MAARTFALARRSFLTDAVFSFRILLKASAKVDDLIFNDRIKHLT